ncbi:MAG TPA: methyltransferase domain-containing protein [Candidatus Angelobacter sp.]|jgi:phospholipid N-methyltransferase|nr:methyltransferase domain-containing protein [Candidatus Angelobacter sp.]
MAQVIRFNIDHTRERKLHILNRGGLAFARSWAAHPLRVGAIAPSSRRLARLITAEISPASAPVLELGAGTGVFTRALLARGLSEEQLILVECDPRFAHLLQRDYPDAWVVQIDAARLCHANIVDGEPAGAVVSGLPLLSMSMRSRIAILQFAFRHLRPGGAYYQFTYGLRCPVPRPVLERLGLKATRMGSTWLNAPPATVYRIRARRKMR